MKHIIITRIKFDDEELFNKYFEVMKNIFIPAIKSQTNKNFKLGFIINQKHIDILKNFFDDNTLYFNNFKTAKEYCIQNNFDIQTRHDCDDWMSENYVQRLQEIYTQNINKYDKFLIHQQGYKLDYNTNDVYLHNIPYWGKQSNSGFISSFLTLCQKKVDTFIFNGNHVKMNETTTSNIIYIDEKLTRLTVHGNNIYSKIRDHDIKLGNSNNYEITIIVPTFDNTDFLIDFIKSIKDSVKNYNVELLIGIDSCKKTKDFIVSSNLIFDKFIKFYFFEINVGPYIVKNSLTKIANSNNILFVDSDDILHKDLIKDTIETLKNFDVFRFRFYNFKNNNDILQYNPNNINPFDSIGQLGIKKNIFLSFNGFEPWRCAADSEFMMRENENRLKVFKSNKILYYRRRHNNSITTRQETAYKSNLRHKYNKIVEEKKKNKNIGKLIELPTTKFFRIENDSSLKLINDYDNLNLFTENKEVKTTKLVIVSTFWNSGKLVSDCINSLKTQSHINFTAYFIDDMSSDDSYDIAKNTIGDDQRFILIKNTEKKYKTKNFIDVIRNNPRINWNDVIVEIDGDDKLADNFVLDRINKVFIDDNIWLCGTKFKDNYGRIGNYGKPNVERPRQTSWNFSHMRSYRAFLFRQIQDEHLKYNGEYFKAACDIAIAIPMMEMSGEQHFYYINEPLYIYNWHNRQSYSDNNSFGDKTLQSKIATYIYTKLPKYGKLVLNEELKTLSEYIEPIVKVTPKKNISETILIHPKTIDYNRINEILSKKPEQKVQPNQKPQVQQNKPISRNVVNDNKNINREKLFKLSKK